MPEVELIVNGYRYAGWKSVRVTRSIESLAGQFALDVSDRWGDELWPIVEGDECRVEIAGAAVISGFIGTRSIKATKDARTLAYTGRDRAAVLVDCSPTLEKWTWRNIAVDEFVRTVARHFGVKVRVQDGLSLGTISKLVATPGDKGYDIIKQATSDQGVLLVSDGLGGILITRAGKGRAAPLVEGSNIETADVDYNGDERYRRYVVATQTYGTDRASGEATRVIAEAEDLGVQRMDRVLLIRPEKGHSAADAKRRADWEARIRAATAETVTISVPGWTQPNGELWPVNAVTHVQARRLIGVDGDLLISQVEYSIGEQGQVTQLRLVRPDAFTPEPVKAQVSGTVGWKELKNGGL